MQNDDDVSAPAVQRVLRETFETVANETIARASLFPNFSSIPQLVERKSVTYKELALINDLMPNLSDDGLIKLEGDFKVFLEVIQHKAMQNDVTWQTIIGGFLFHPEAQRINAFLNEH